MRRKEVAQAHSAHRRSARQRVQPVTLIRVHDSLDGRRRFGMEGLGLLQRERRAAVVDLVHASLRWRAIKA
ncbi:hypothetical protein D3C72_2281630 [compost metagenome]